MSDTSWMLRGACRHEDPELFHPDGETESYATQISEAKAVCAVCPVVLNCYAHVIGRKEVGIWAGMTESERTELRNDLARKHCGGCDQSLPLSEFYRRPSATDGFRPRCKRCENRKRVDIQRETRAAKKEVAA